MSLKYLILWSLVIIESEFKCIDDHQRPLYYQNDRTIQVDISTELTGRRMHHFWESTGYCPPDPHDKSAEFMLSDDMNQNEALIGSLPHNGIKQIRIHFLLKLISAENRLNEIHYNFSNLDKLLIRLKESGLRPGFEIMGNPSNLFNDFENRTQVYEWKSLVKQLATRYLKMFGIDYLRQWNFESWNEPSIEFKTHFKDNIKVTQKGFLNYYDACSQGLKEVDSGLRFGGPGDHWPRDVTNGPFVIDLVEHYINGTNYITGKKSDTKLDFISLHEKGDHGDSSYIDYLENKALNDIRDKFPSLSEIPFVENEGDPEVTWDRNRTWRADNRYAATMAAALIRRINHYNHSNPLSLYGFDNGFLSYYPFQFTQRTLLARFQINNTIPKYTQFVRKPGFSLMGLMAKLGDNLIELKTNTSVNDTFSAIATAFVGKESDKNPTDFTILLVNSKDTFLSDNKTSVDLRISFGDISSRDDWKWSKYDMNNQKTNPFQIWTEQDCPPYPSQELFAKMRDQEEPSIAVNAKSFELINNQWNYSTDIAFPAISLIQICRKTLISPEMVTDLRDVYRTKSSVLLTWSPTYVRCIKTYEVQYSSTGLNNTFNRINEKDIIYPSFQFMVSNQTIDGFYRIRVIDFWDRKSDFSQVLQLKNNSTLNVY